MGAFFYKGEKVYNGPNKNTIDLIKDKTDKISTNLNTFSFNCNNLSIANINKITISNNHDIILTTKNIVNDYTQDIEMSQNNFTSYPGHTEKLLCSISLNQRINSNFPSPAQNNYWVNNASINFSYDGLNGPQLGFGGICEWSGSGVHTEDRRTTAIGLNGITISTKYNASASPEVQTGTINIGREFTYVQNTTYMNGDQAFNLSTAKHTSYMHSFNVNHYNKSSNNNYGTTFTLNSSGARMNTFINESNRNSAVVTTQNRNSVLINIRTSVDGVSQYSRFIVNSNGPYWIYPNNTVKSLI